MSITAEHAYFIKLGERGSWEAECLRDNVLRLGYQQAPDDQCQQGNWEAVRQSLLALGHSAGVATRHTNQIRIFYEAGEDSIFITFMGGALHWCRPTGPVEALEDGSRRRGTVEGWRNTSLQGNILYTDRLSGNLSKVQMFQGTICRVREKDYLLRKLSDELSPKAKAADEAEHTYLSVIIDFMQMLNPKDFEILVDLIFARSGWIRTGEVGGSQRFADIELVLPSTGDRAFVQVKSKTHDASFGDYLNLWEQTDVYDRMFFAWHTGDIKVDAIPAGVTLLGPEKLSRMVLDAGLASWLRDKASAYDKWWE